MGGRIGRGFEFFCFDLDAVLWLGESLRFFSFIPRGERGGKGSQGTAGVDIGMMVKLATVDEQIYGLSLAMDCIGFWGVGTSECLSLERSRGALLLGNRI